MIDFVVTVDSHLRLSPFQHDTEDWHKGIGSLVLAMAAGDPEDPDSTFSMMGMDVDRRITLPRGFAWKLWRGFGKLGFRVVWDDQRVSTERVLETPQIELRDYQQKAEWRFVQNEQGIWEAPPGAGKTTGGCHLIDMIGMRSIVLLDKVNIVQQWRDEWEFVTGKPSGQIAEGVFDPQWVTFATWQGIYQKREQLKNEGFFQQWGFLGLDECHNISAPAIRELIQFFPARYRCGFSATPDRDEWLQHVSRSMIGEIICRTGYDELERAGVLVRPKVIAVKTPFFYPWKERLNPQTQWQEMLKALKTDEGRNRLFAQLAGAQRGHTVLVATDHKEHAKILAGYAALGGWPDDRILMLTGEQSGKKRQAVKERAAEGDCIVFSTIGQEALNFPRLNRVFLVFPTKKDLAVRQLSGRVMRTHESKTEAPLVIDFYDHEVRRLANHFNRRRGSYDRQGFEVAIVDPPAG